MLYLELITIFTAIILAWQNKWPVYKFREAGANEQMEEDFHEANAWIKGIFAFNIAALNASIRIIFETAHWYDFFVFFLLYILILWFVFDIALNVFVDGWKKWAYLGKTAKTDRLLRFGTTVKVFNWKIKIPGLGDNAGKIKAAGCFALIAILNVLYQVL